MMNFVRSDLYRMWRSGYALGSAMFVLFIAAAITGVGVIACVLSDEPLSTWNMGGSFLQMTANMGFAARLLPVTASFPVIAMLADDAKGGLHETLFACEHARRDYLGAKLVIAILLALVVPALMLACMAVLPFLLGMPYDAAPAISDVIIWWALAALACLAYSALSIAAGMMFRSETAIYIAGFLIVLGSIGNFITMLLSFVAVLLPTLADAINIAISLLPSACAETIGNATTFAGFPAADYARAIAIPVAWTVAATTGSWLALRKKTV